MQNQELEDLIDSGSIGFRSRLKDGEQFIATDLFLSPMSALTGALYFQAKGYLTGKSTEINLVCFRPRSSGGIEEYLTTGQAHQFTDGSMKSIRVHRVYKVH